MKIFNCIFLIIVFAILNAAARQQAMIAAPSSDSELERLYAVSVGRASDARKADAFYSLGEIYMERSRTQEALNYYLSSYNHSRSRKRKLRALERLSDIYYSGGSLGKAIEFAKEAAAISPRETKIAKKLSGYYVKADLRIQAVEEYKKILERDPDDIEALVGAAGVLESLGLYADAIEHYKKAIVRGAYRDVTLRVAYCYEIFSERAVAEALLKEYLAVHPDYGGFIQLGKLYYSSREYARAAEAFSSAVKINPRGREALLLSGIAYYKSSMPDEAAEMLKILLMETPDSAAAHFFLGLVLDSSNEKSAAAQYGAALRGLTGEDSLLAVVTLRMMKSSPTVLRTHSR
ncbi:MAG: tetratricopeptide repeat protein [Endomicrobiia bacterium]|nr:tetratricopeptide repeat protein [Endomicrobiia bacterium]